MSDGTHIKISDLSILLVEPSKTQFRIIAKHLSAEGINYIEHANSAADVFRILADYQPDLIISSMYLPDTTAVELVEKIKLSENLKEIPVMLISSETSFKALDPIRQAGVIAILPKPFTHVDIERALASTIDYIDPDEITLKHYEIENLRVLVVDDSMMARNHITRVLNNMGITQITKANDGKEGVEIFEQDEDAFDLIVTDFNMPNMDGGQLIEYIRNDLSNPLIPIIMVTSEDNEIRLNAVHQAGVSGICDKPFEPQTVKDMLYKLLDDD